MNTKRRTGWEALGALVLGSFLATSASAALSDSLTVTITPSASYAVDVDTAISPALLDLGVVALNTSTATVNVTTVTVQSSFATTDLSIQAQVISGGWNIDADTTAQEQDGLQTWAVFTDTSATSAVTVAAETGAFDAADLLMTAARDVGQLGAGARQYEVTSGQPAYKSMEDLPSVFGVDPPASRSHLWLKFLLPPVSTTMTAKQVYITVSAGAPN